MEGVSDDIILLYPLDIWPGFDRVMGDGFSGGSLEQRGQPARWCPDHWVDSVSTRAFLSFEHAKGFHVLGAIAEIISSLTQVAGI